MGFLNLRCNWNNIIITTIIIIIICGLIYIIIASTDINITVGMKILYFLLTNKPFSLSQKRDIAVLACGFLQTCLMKSIHFTQLN